MALTQREELIANLYLAHPDWSYEKIGEAAKVPVKARKQQVHRVLTRGDVQEYVENRRKLVAKRVDRTREDLVRAMWDVVDQRAKDRVAAAALISKMAGWDAPQKIEHSGEVRLWELPPLAK